MPLLAARREGGALPARQHPGQSPRCTGGPPPAPSGKAARQEGGRVGEWGRGAYCYFQPISNLNIKSLQKKKQAGRERGRVSGGGCVLHIGHLADRARPPPGPASSPSGIGPSPSWGPFVPGGARPPPKASAGLHMKGLKQYRGQ